MLSRINADAHDEVRECRRNPTTSVLLPITAAAVVKNKSTSGAHFEGIEADKLYPVARDKHGRRPRYARREVRDDRREVALQIYAVALCLEYLACETDS